MPIERALRQYPKTIVVATLSTACYSFAVWYLTTFPPVLYGTLMDPPLGGGGQSGEGRIWLMHSLCCLLLSCFYPVWGWAGNSIGASNMMVLGGLVLAVMGPPCCLMMSAGSFAAAALGQGLLSVGIGITGASLPTFLVSAFPPHVRYTCIAIGYNVSLATFGGTAALISSSLFQQSQGNLLSGLYFSFLGLVSSASVHSYTRHGRQGGYLERDGRQLSVVAQGSACTGHAEASEAVAVEGESSPVR